MDNNRGRRPTLRSLLGWLIGLAALAWVLWGLDWGELARALSSISWPWLVAAVGSFLLSLALKLVRWRGLLAGIAPGASWLQLARALFLGQAVNILGVGRFGEVARVVWLQRALSSQNPPASQHSNPPAGAGLATSVIAEKVLDLFFLGVAGAWWLAVVFTPDGSQRIYLFLLTGFAGLGAIFTLGAFGGPLFARIQAALERRSGRIWRWLGRQLEELARGLKSLVSRRALGYNLGLSGLIWAVMTLTDALLLKTFDLPFSFNLALTVVVWGHLGVVTNLTPANIGPHEWAITFGLSTMDVPRGVAFAYALVLHAIVVVIPLLIALAVNGWVWPSRDTINQPLPSE